MPGLREPVVRAAGPERRQREPVRGRGGLQSVQGRRGERCAVGGGGDGVGDGDGGGGGLWGVEWHGDESGVGWVEWEWEWEYGTG